MKVTVFVAVLNLIGPIVNVAEESNPVGWIAEQGLLKVMPHIGRIARSVYKMTGSMLRVCFFSVSRCNVRNRDVKMEDFVLESSSDQHRWGR